MVISRPRNDNKTITNRLAAGEITIMKNKKHFKDNFIEFIGELTAGFILVLTVAILLIIGWVIVCLFPEKVFTIFAEMTELVILIGFFTLLVLLYVISKIIQIMHKVKEKSANTNSIIENSPDGD
jgi:type VI protein secretion system component VasK